MKSFRVRQSRRTMIVLFFSAYWRIFMHSAVFEEDARQNFGALRTFTKNKYTIINTFKKTTLKSKMCLMSLSVIML